MAMTGLTRLLARAAVLAFLVRFPAALLNTEHLTLLEAGPNAEGSFRTKLDVSENVDNPEAPVPELVNIPIETRSAAPVPENTCTAEYRAIPSHTMCLTDSPRVVDFGVTAGQKQEIVDLHNKLRGKVSPSAADLTVMIWDDKLAAVAAKWARQCLMGHDPERGVPAYGTKIGQNVAGGYSNWDAAIMAWWDEVTMYVFGAEPNSYLGEPDGWKKIGHYTQMVQNTTYRVGCGYAKCRDSSYSDYYVCNYLGSQSRLAWPYTRGPRCGSCPRNCNQGQCDCKGKVCLNGGTLNIATCSCSCASIYSGPDCSELNCPAEEAVYCGRNLNASTCTLFSNVPQMCPYMCGLCSGSNAKPGGGGGGHGGLAVVNKPTTPQAAFVSSFGCQFSGKRASLQECKRYGDKGNDKPFCASMGGTTGCMECQRFFNIKTDYCPVMCGLCDAPCNGKRCQNGGQLKTDTCQCECPAPYIGNTCEKAKCPVKDPAHCVVYQAAFCKVYVNVPGECPYLCGIC